MMGDLHEGHALHDLHGLALGFADPVAGSQAAFRCALQALAQPGTPVTCPVSLPPVPGLMPATAALLLTLTDHETPVWWATPAAAPSAAPARWLQFHTGAVAAAQPAEAAFAVVALGQALPALAHLAAGSDESPERSATLLIELPAMTEGEAQRWSGPGLREPRTVCLAGLPAPFWAQWQDNHARFPSGVDVLFVCGHQLIGLPRTTAVCSARAC